LANREPERFLVLDASETVEQISQKLISELEKRFQ